MDLDGEKLFNLPGFAVHSVIVERNGRGSSSAFLHDDLDAVQQIFGGGGTCSRTWSISAASRPWITEGWISRVVGCQWGRISRPRHSTVSSS